MLNRRSILKFLGCAPCVPIAAKVDDFWDDWHEGFIAAQHSEGFFGHTYVSIGSENLRPITVGHGYHITISGPGWACNFPIYSIAFDSRAGVPTYEITIPVITTVFISRETENVHFRVEAAK